jgi:4-amino-4-deoxy-L-arabinose transferase-like glycosyltransferase
LNRYNSGSENALTNERQQLVSVWGIYLQSSTLAKRGWQILFFSIAAFYLSGLGTLPLVGPDEPRYAEVAREMFARHDLITPTLGGLPWFEKPPLLYWLMIACYRVLGVNEYAARLGPAICGLLTAAFVHWIGKTIENTATAGENESRRDGLGRVSALVWLSSLGAIVFSRGASFDVVVTMTITGALACFFVWQVKTPGRDAGEPQAGMPALRLLLVGFYFFVGLSLLAKGLIGIVIPAGVIGSYFLLHREWPSRKLLKSLLWGGPLAIGVAAVWFGPMLARHGWKFIDQFIIQHHFARFVSNKYHHPAPFYFYLVVLIALCLPWTTFLGASFFSSRRWLWKSQVPLDRFKVFTLCWLVVPVLFFSFSESKLTAYILPALPAAVLLIGERVTCFLRAQRGDLVLRLTGVLLLGLSIAGAVYLERHQGLNSLLIYFGLSPLALVGATSLARPQWRSVLVILIPLAWLVAAASCLTGAAPVMSRSESVRDLLAAAAARGYGSTRVAQLHTVERTAEFYAAYRMDYGSDGEPIKLEGVAQVADAARRNGGMVLCFVPKEYEAQLTSYQPLHEELIGDNGRVSLVIVSVRDSIMPLGRTVVEPQMGMNKGRRPAKGSA